MKNFKDIIIKIILRILLNGWRKIVIGPCTQARVESRTKDFISFFQPSKVLQGVELEMINVDGRLLVHSSKINN